MSHFIKGKQEEEAVSTAADGPFWVYWLIFGVSHSLEKTNTQHFEPSINTCCIFLINFVTRGTEKRCSAAAPSSAMFTGAISILALDVWMRTYARTRARFQLSSLMDSWLLEISAKPARPLII